MIRIVCLFLFLFFWNLSFSQNEKFHGKWIFCGQWGMNSYKIRKSQKVICFSAGCTDRGTKQVGTWSSKGDTITIVFEEKLKQLVYKEGCLQHYYPELKLISNRGILSNIARYRFLGRGYACRKYKKWIS